MSLARKCDRCGSFYSPESRLADGEYFNAFSLVYRKPNYTPYANKTYDLCPKCSSSLLEWFNDYNQKKA